MSTPKGREPLKGMFKTSQDLFKRQFAADMLTTKPVNDKGESVAVSDATHTLETKAEVGADYAVRGARYGIRKGHEKITEVKARHKGEKSAGVDTPPMANRPNANTAAASEHMTSRPEVPTDMNGGDIPPPAGNTPPEKLRAKKQFQVEKAGEQKKVAESRQNDSTTRPGGERVRPRPPTERGETARQAPTSLRHDNVDFSPPAGKDRPTVQKQVELKRATQQRQTKGETAISRPPQKGDSKAIPRQAKPSVTRPAGVTGPGKEKTANLPGGRKSLFHQQPAARMRMRVQPGHGPLQGQPYKLAARKAKLYSVRKAQGKLAQAGQRGVRVAGKGVATAIKRLAASVAAAVKAAVSAMAPLLGLAGAFLLMFIIIGAVAATIASPFGIFFAGENQTAGTVSPSEAVAQINIEFGNQLGAMQSGYDSVSVQGYIAEWGEVLAVFAAKTVGADGPEAMDVVTLDADRVAMLTAVFWDMNTLTSLVETIEHSGGNPNDPEGGPWTERILHITITPKVATDMPQFYRFTDYQRDALTELLADRAALASLAGDLTITNADAMAVLKELPADLDPNRREVVETALQLVGKVNYFWGGKSYAIGWDSRWGTLQRVWADGNSTSGTYRPYGLDCTGYLDWAIRNAGLHSDGHWYIGTNLTATTWDAAQPGDIALFPDDSHVGLVVGRNADGKVLVAHCNASRNNVSITEAVATGFTDVGTAIFY